MVHGHTRYLNWLFDSTPETIRRWIPEHQLQQDLGTFFDRVWVERTETPDWLSGYARTCHVDDATPNDYRMREIGALYCLRDGGRFAGLMAARPNSPASVPCEPRNEPDEKMSGVGYD
jgi:hypothetical protein